jgi:hypothetical protein
MIQAFYFGDQPGAVRSSAFEYRRTGAGALIAPKRVTLERRIP